MGCNSSKLDNEEAVQLCKDRKKFIKQAVEQQVRFTSAHIAYIQSLKRVSAAIREYIEGDELHEILPDSYITPSLTPLKKSTSRFITIAPKCLIETPNIQSQSKASVSVSYYRPSGNPAIAVEERGPETVQIQSYSPLLSCGIDGFFTTQSPSLNPSCSPNNKPNLPPPSPQDDQWDFFWNPFSSLGYDEYPTMSSFDRSVMEEETEHEKINTRRVHVREERTKSSVNSTEEVVVEDVVKDEDDDMTGASKHEMNGTKSHDNQSVELSQAPEAQKFEVHHQETKVGEHEKKEEAPGFTVCVNRRPTSMEEVIKDLQTQFMIVCNSAKEVSLLLESSQAKYLSTSHEISCSRDEGYESGSFSSAESFTFSGSHQSTLDRLYEWEKRLYEEVRSGERIRQTYEKICKRLKTQVVEKQDASFVEKTRATIRDLHAKMQVAMHSIEAISMRIETVRDKELHPQLLELLQCLARMWKVTAESHQMQKCTLDEAKLLLAGGTPLKPNKSSQHSVISATTIYPNRLAQSAFNLETELRNWRACFESWITSLRSYLHCLTSWLLRCMRCEPDTSKPLFSPQNSPSSKAAPPIFNICIQWSRFIDKVSEDSVMASLDFFAAGIKSIYVQQIRVDSRRDHGINVDGQEEEAMTAEKMEEIAMKLLCAGMSAAVSSLTDFAICSAEGHAELVNQRETVKRPPPSSGDVS